MGLSVAAGAMALAALECDGPLRSFERKSLNPGLRSSATPSDVGVAFERVSIASGPRTLDGFLVRADAGCPRSGAVLIFHGRNETIADWIMAQRIARERCISSLVFDYSGHGRSSPSGTVDHLNSDSLAAYAAFLRYFPANERRCLLGHSMGGAPLLYAATHAPAAPDCVILNSPFSSLREMAIRGGLPKWLSFVMADVWDNVRAVADLRAPMLWIHSRSDTTIPIGFGQRVYDAKVGPKTAVVLDGLGHDAIYDGTAPEIWSPITAFVLGEIPR